MKKEFYDKLKRMYDEMSDIVENSTNENIKETIDLIMLKVNCKNYTAKESYGLLTHSYAVEWKMKWIYPHQHNTKGYYDGSWTVIGDSSIGKTNHKHDLQIVVEDLLMGFCRTNNVNDFHNTYDLAHYLNGDKNYLNYEIVIED